MHAPKLPKVVMCPQCYQRMDTLQYERNRWQWHDYNEPGRIHNVIKFYCDRCSLGINEWGVLITNPEEYGMPFRR